MINMIDSLGGIVMINMIYKCMISGNVYYGHFIYKQINEDIFSAYKVSINMIHGIVIVNTMNVRLWYENVFYGIVQRTALSFYGNNSYQSCRWPWVGVTNVHLVDFSVRDVFLRYVPIISIESHS